MSRGMMVIQVLKMWRASMSLAGVLSRPVKTGGGSVEVHHDHLDGDDDDDSDDDGEEVEKRKKE